MNIIRKIDSLLSAQTFTEISRPYLISIESEALKQNNKVNVQQVYSLDYTEEGEERLK